jgi:hypothetical protein
MCVLRVLLVPVPVMVPVMVPVVVVVVAAAAAAGCCCCCCCCWLLLLAAAAAAAAAACCCLLLPAAACCCCRLHETACYREMWSFPEFNTCCMSVPLLPSPVKEFHCRSSSATLVPLYRVPHK